MHMGIISLTIIVQRDPIEMLFLRSGITFEK